MYLSTLKTRYAYTKTLLTLLLRSTALVRKKLFSLFVLLNFKLRLQYTVENSMKRLLHMYTLFRFRTCVDVIGRIQVQARISFVFVLRPAIENKNMFVVRNESCRTFALRPSNNNICYTIIKCKEFH